MNDMGIFKSRFASPFLVSSYTKKQDSGEHHGMLHLAYLMLIVIFLEQDNQTRQHRTLRQGSSGLSTCTTQYLKYLVLIELLADCKCTGVMIHRQQSYLLMTLQLKGELTPMTSSPTLTSARFTSTENTCYETTSTMLSF